MKPHDASRLERLLAWLLRYGVRFASAVVAAGLAVAWLGSPAAGMGVVQIGVALFIFLPAVRLAAMAVVFLQEGDRRFALISVVVLAILALGLAVGLHAPRSPGEPPLPHAAGNIRY